MLNANERAVLQKNVKNYFVKNRKSSKAEAANHFIKEGYCRTTVYAYINRELNGQALKPAANGGHSSTWTRKNKTTLKRLTNNRKGVSQRKLARKFNVNQSTICRQLAKMKIQYRKRKKTPKYNDEQLLRAQKRSRKLVNHLYNSQDLDDKFG